MGKLIYGDKLISTLVWGHYEIGKQLQTVQKAIDDMRGEDAVPVIRCKDCLYLSRLEDSGYYSCCRTEDDEIELTDYCSKARRKDDGKTD